MEWYKLAYEDIDFGISEEVKKVIEDKMEIWEGGEEELRKLAFSISVEIISSLPLFYQKHTGSNEIDNFEKAMEEVDFAFHEVKDRTTALAGGFKDYIVDIMGKAPPEDFDEGPGMYIDQNSEGYREWYGVYEAEVEKVRNMVKDQLQSAFSFNKNMFCGFPMMASKTFNLKKFAEKTHLDAKTRKRINTEIYNLTTPGYKTEFFEAIPLQEIFDILKNNNLVVLQEDNTPWSGLLLGDEQSVTFPLAYKDPIDPSEFFRTEEGEEEKEEEEAKQYEPITNALLYLYWYKMPSGKYEINAYIT